jgi:SAM-dependent methyltransferase
MLRPPRYLLRERVVVGVLDALGAKSIAEVGCGAGEILVTLEEKGFRGVGYDPSETARTHARKRLLEARSKAFTISDDWPEAGAFDAVLLLEVLGYADDPVALLERCKTLLRPGGHLVVSYARTGSGYDPRIVAGMRFFDEHEVEGMLGRAGFVEPRRQNYGFPLVNLLVGLNNLVFRLRYERRGKPLEVEDTGLVYSSNLLRPLGLVSNRFTLSPFFALQRLFADTHLGNGDVLVARVNS